MSIAICGDSLQSDERLLRSLSVAEKLDRRPVFHEELGQQLKALRTRREWSVQQAVNYARSKGHTGLTWNKLTLLEGGKTKFPEREALQAVAALYDLRFDELARSFVLRNYGSDVIGPAQPVVTLEGFEPVRVLSRAVGAGQPIVVDAEDGNESLAFRNDFTRRFTNPIAVRVGRDQHSMVPTVHPGDVLVIDRSERVRLKPDGRRIYALNLDGGAMIKRVEVAGQWLLVSSDNLDKGHYPTRPVPLDDMNLLDVVVGEVVWIGRYIGSGRKR